MIQVTLAKVNQLIDEYRDAGMSEEDIQELIEYRDELQSGSLRMPSKNSGVMYKHIDEDTVRMSTAPMSIDDDLIDEDFDEDFEKAEFKPVKPRDKRKPA